ncbi:MAG: RNA ligase family protein [Actinobacteria bacterium]|nr:RNA ligase family protein [Actinomycetota bacterium]
MLGPHEVDALLSAPVSVEEKLDGANVVVWMEADRVECALRSGPGAMDRAGQLGPLRAWLAQHDDAVRRLLVDATAIYGEWLLVTHSVAYDRLPAYLIVLDLWRPESGFFAIDERNFRCGTAGLATPPEVWRGVPRRLDVIERLLGLSAWGPEPMEGVVVRSLEAPARMAKVVRAQFDRLDDEGWRRGRPRNRLVDQEASWR